MQERVLYNKRLNFKCLLCFDGCQHMQHFCCEEASFIVNAFLFSELSVYELWRFLFSQEALGIPVYTRNKDKLLLHYGEQKSNAKFRKRMASYLKFPEKHVILTEDIRNMIYLMEEEKDIDLLFEMLRRFNKQNKVQSFSNYKIGPIIMRACYYLCLPTTVFKLVKNEEFEGLFDQFSSFIIAMDLLYETCHYEKVLEVFEILKRKQLYGLKFPTNSVLAFAACYKINTPESYKKGLKYFEDSMTMNGFATRRSLLFLAALALNQNDPQAVMEILSTLSINFYIASNLKLMALADLDRLEDALVILNDIFSSNVVNRKEFCLETFERLRAACVRNGNKEITEQIMNTIQYLIQEQPKKVSIDTLLSAPIRVKSELEQIKDQPLHKLKGTKNQSQQYTNHENTIKD